MRWSSLLLPLRHSRRNPPGRKPNILIIWGDDIGYWNLSAYNQGMMGYKTPNIDRIAKEGALFTDWYGQQSCTAGRSCFITGQSRFPHRHAQGRPARREGRLAGAGRDDRRVAQGAGLHDRAVRQEPPRRPRRTSAHRARLRRVLSARSTTSTPRKSRRTRTISRTRRCSKKYGTRGVLHTWANPDGTQKIEITGPLTIEAHGERSTTSSPRRRCVS